MKILVVDDNEPLARGLVSFLKSERHEARMAVTAHEGLSLIQKTAFDLIVTDLRLPDGSGLDVIKAARTGDSPPEVILMTAFSSVETAVEAMKLGAMDYLTKPVPLEEFAFRIKRVLQIRSVRKNSIVLKRNEQDLLDSAGFSSPLEELVGDSVLMRSAKEMIRKCATYPTTVLITGETGVGKELAARALHALSPRKDQPFIKVNCASIPETLFESELFGHERGAFTDARERRSGRFELAHEGTLFLDEVGEVPIHLQSKLLRVLQDKEITRVGGSEVISVDVRIIAATNRNLHQLVSEGGFREDLLYRLSVIQIELPSLRDRAEDIPFLARHLLSRLGTELGKTHATLSSEAEALLSRQRWPGNVRELRNTLERSLVLSESEILDPGQFALSQVYQTSASSLATYSTVSKLSEDAFPKNGLVQYLEEIEKKWLISALEKTGGNRAKASELLQLSRTNLIYRLKKLGLESEKSGLESGE